VHDIRVVVISSEFHSWSVYHISNHSMASSSSSEVPDAEGVAFRCYASANHHLVGKYRKISATDNSIRYANGSNPKVFATRTNGGWEFIHESRINGQLIRTVICRSAASSEEGALLSFDPSMVKEWVNLEAKPMTMEFLPPLSSDTDSESAADRSEPPASPPTAQPSRKKQKQKQRYSEEMPLMPWLPENGWRIPGVQQMPLAQAKVHN
jgi:hypothetical protein